MKIPKKLTKTIYLHARTDDEWGDGFKAFDFQAIGDEYILLCQQEVTFSIPETDITGKQIESLETQKEEIMAEAREKAAILEDRISKLRCLPNLSDQEEQ